MSLKSCSLICATFIVNSLLLAGCIETHQKTVSEQYAGCDYKVQIRYASKDAEVISLVTIANDIFNIANSVHPKTKTPYGMLHTGTTQSGYVYIRLNEPCSDNFPYLIKFQQILPSKLRSTIGKKVIVGELIAITPEELSTINMGQPSL